jgi:hypothetical protein
LGEVTTSSALDRFRAQREAVDQVHAGLAGVEDSLERLQAQGQAIAQNQAFCQVLPHDELWLESARRTIAEVRAFRLHRVALLADAHENEIVEDAFRR